MPPRYDDNQIPVRALHSHKGTEVYIALAHIGEEDDGDDKKPPIVPLLPTPLYTHNSLSLSLSLNVSISRRLQRRSSGLKSIFARSPPSSTRRGGYAYTHSRIYISESENPLRGLSVSRARVDEGKKSAGRPCAEAPRIYNGSTCAAAAVVALVSVLCFFSLASGCSVYMCTRRRHNSRAGDGIVSIGW